MKGIVRRAVFHSVALPHPSHITLHTSFCRQGAESPDHGFHETGAGVRRCIGQAIGRQVAVRPQRAETRRLRVDDFGVVRQYRFLEDAEVSLLTERRVHPPWGLEGGEAGLCGRNDLDGYELPGKIQFNAVAGQTLTIMTPGGGGYGLLHTSFRT